MSPFYRWKRENKSSKSRESANLGTSRRAGNRTKVFGPLSHVSQGEAWREAGALESGLCLSSATS